jgi:hypothetical protein
MARVGARINELMMFKSKIVAGGGIEPPTRFALIFAGHKRSSPS